MCDLVQCICTRLPTPDHARVHTVPAAHIALPFSGTDCGKYILKLEDWSYLYHNLND